ncbi:hypothetical protein PseBG33_4782 [Pseudomonas synxantha BG33R]|uniref:beta family protein n=1 Tax=Pseudomonas synxantha TaxID=47883 RepID=UPI00025FFA5A|nr:hypothetical protein [Pseudomonas synxantha]EIK73619.1 hypothetical protein PseBG33_4782 [Pseudomonas synxantha BG33R]
MHKNFADRKYIPLLAISIAEITAMEQLPDKDRDMILPLFPLKGWASAHKLSSSIKKIREATGSRPWIADIDTKFLSSNKTFLFTGSFPERPVFHELQKLLDPHDAFNNWYEFIKGHEEAIPCLRLENLENLEELREQAIKLCALARGLVIRINPTSENYERQELILRALGAEVLEKTLMIYDLGQIDAKFGERINTLVSFITSARAHASSLEIAVSASSFPYGFAGQKQGENSIYERMLYNQISERADLKPIIYSDRGSARADKQDGGAGTPPPRIDYPLKKDWKFVRREVDDDAPNAQERRRAAYIEIAKEITTNTYWIPELRLWGTQQIEITAEGSEFGISSPMRSTAVRINIHLFNQLHYDTETSEIDTDEEWTD